MADDLFMFGAAEVARIAKAVRKSEEPPVSPAASRPPGRSPAFIRAILLEPLHGHGSALAVRCKRISGEQQQDVQLVGALDYTDDKEAFRLSMMWGEPGEEVNFVSDPIRIYASADEFLEGLTPWTFAASGDLYVSGGLVDPAEVPPELREMTHPAVLARWTVTFAGRQFDNRVLPRIQVEEQADLQFGALLVTFPSSWQQTPEVVQVFEGGLMPDSPQTSVSPPPSRTPLQPGSAVLCAWCPDADGYVVCSAEARKYRVFPNAVAF